MMIRIHPYHYVRWDEVLEVLVPLGDPDDAPTPLVVKLRGCDPVVYTFSNENDAMTALEEIVATIDAEAELARGESPAP